MARILLAEADRSVRELIAGILSDFGHRVENCADRTEADACLAATSVDIVVTDMVLRGGEGMRFGRRCVGLGIPTITLSGEEFRPDRVGTGGAEPLFDKPFRFADLQNVLDAVARHLGAEAPDRLSRSSARPAATPGAAHR